MPQFTCLWLVAMYCTKIQFSPRELRTRNRSSRIAHCHLTLLPGLGLIRDNLIVQWGEQREKKDKKCYFKTSEGSHSTLVHLHGIIYCNIVCNWKTLETSTCPKWWNKLWYTHIMENYIAIKKNKTDLHELVKSDFQDILFRKKSKV